VLRAGLSVGGIRRGNWEGRGAWQFCALWKSLRGARELHLTTETQTLLPWESHTHASTSDARGPARGAAQHCVNGASALRGEA